MSGTQDAPEQLIVNDPPPRIAPVKPRQGTSCLVWIVDVTLLGIAVVGVFYAWPVQAEATRLAKKRADMQARLETQVGHMPISDESKYHILRLPNVKPGEIRWRVYAPPRGSHTLQIKSSSEGSNSHSSSGSSGATESSEGLVRAVFTFDEGGTAQMMVKFRMTGNHSSHQTQILDKQIVEMLRKNDFSRWKIAGGNGVEKFEIDELIPLLHVETSSGRENVTGGLLDVSFGTQGATPRKDTGK